MIKSVDKWRRRQKEHIRCEVLDFSLNLTIHEAPCEAVLGFFHLKTCLSELSSKTHCEKAQCFR